MIDRLDWRLDGDGYLDRHTHLFVQEARAGARARRVTRGDWSVESFSWSPDGKRLAFSADPRAGADLAAAPAVYVGVRARRRAGRARSPGRLLQCGLLVARRRARRVPGHRRGGRAVRLRGVALGRAVRRVVAPRDLAQDRHLHLALVYGSDLIDYDVDGGSGLTWDGDGDVLSPLTLAGHTAVWSFSLAGEPAQRTAPGHVHGYAAARRQDGDVARRRGRRDRTARRATGRGAPPPDARRHGLAAPARGRRLRGVRGARPGGAHPRDGRRSPWRRSQALPLVLSIVGGPGSSWGPEPWLPDWVLAEAGARVICPDPRGSGSYGRAWLEAISGAWGDADAADDLACVDWAVGEGLADPARLGVTGLSYGGFMTQWLIGQDDRFRAAVAVNGVANQISAAGNCDQGALWTPRLGWKRPPADSERLWQQSPLAHAETASRLRS